MIIDPLKFSPKTSKRNLLQQIPKLLDTQILPNLINYITKLREYPMKKKYFLFTVFTITLIVISACAGSSQQLELPAELTVLKYRSAPGMILTYNVKDTFIQTMNFQGQKSETTIQKDITSTMVSTGSSDGDLNFDVTIDEISMDVSSDPGGDLTPDLTQIPDIPFKLKIDQLGEEIEVIGAELLKYSLGQSGERTLKRDFEHFFPDLPGYALNIGDTWTITDTLDLSEGNTNLKLIIVSNNKLGGYELIAEHQCTRIEVEYTSTVLSSGIQQDTNFSTSVEINGSETWYFDYIQGVYVKLTSLGSGEGTVTVSGPQSMIIPVSQSIAIDVSLVE
jgi:hypothetical protein